MTTVAFGAAVAMAGLLIAAAGARKWAAAGRSDAVEAILDEGEDYRAALHRPFAVRLFGPAASTMAGWARSATPARWLQRIRRKATLAGMEGPGLEGILALKAALTLAGGLLAPLGMAALGGKFGGAVIWGLLGGAIGFVLPDVWLARKAESRQADIRRTLPETLDLLAISVQAGLGLEAAIELVSRKLPGALGDELHRLLQEVQLGTSRREALQKLRERTDVAELSTFALAVVQADSIGSPIGDVLRAHAAEIRMIRRQRAREAAAKVPVKLLFPLLLGIFPALGIVIVGPAIVSIGRAFGMH